MSESETHHSISMELAWALIRHRPDLAAELRLRISAMRRLLVFLSEFVPVILLLLLMFSFSP
jgi:hypothetical protein